MDILFPKWGASPSRARMNDGEIREDFLVLHFSVMWQNLAFLAVHRKRRRGVQEQSRREMWAGLGRESPEKMEGGDQSLGGCGQKGISWDEEWSINTRTVTSTVHLTLVTWLVLHCNSPPSPQTFRESLQYTSNSCGWVLGGNKERIEGQFSVIRRCVERAWTFLDF